MWKSGSPAFGLKRTSTDRTSPLQRHLPVWSKGYVSLMELGGLAPLEAESDRLLAPVEEQHGLGDVAANHDDAKVEKGLVGILEL